VCAASIGITPRLKAVGATPERDTCIRRIGHHMKTRAARSRCRDKLIMVKRVARVLSRQAQQLTVFYYTWVNPRKVL
jgi:hypothetical protein